MEILLYKIPQNSDLQIGLQVCYKSLNGAFTQLGIITDTFEQDGFTMYILNSAMGAYMANELRLFKTVETGCPFDELFTYNPSTLIN